MLSDRKTAFWIVLTLIVCMFAFFVVIAALFVPADANAANIAEGSADEALVGTIASLRQAIWWTTMATVMLPIMMMMLALAMYLFVTGNPATAHAQATAGAKPKLFGIVPKSAPKKAEATSTSDILDLRYARGEITREQYLAMKEDLKAQAAPQTQQAQRL